MSKFREGDVCLTLQKEDYFIPKGVLVIVLRIDGEDCFVRQLTGNKYKSGKWNVMNYRLLKVDDPFIQDLFK